VIVALESHEGAVDRQITTIGFDLAKNVFQVHGIDAAEKVVVRKRLRRSQVMGFFEALAPCLVGMEACATAHYWARELTKIGHEVRLMPAKDVKAYVKRNKSDAADAEAICEAVRRPTMRFVRIKSAEQQGQLMRSPPSLLTTAACSGLRPEPDCRPRRTYLHLSYSCASPFGPAILMTHDPKRTWRERH
jgi:Transposase